MVNIALIGDVHTDFDQADVDYFNQSSVDLILFVGDLGRYRHKEGVDTARVLSRLAKPTIYIPGNHDAMIALQLYAELKEWSFWQWLTSLSQPRRAQQLDEALGDVLMSGYKTHSFDLKNQAFDVITARPFSFGESRLSYGRYLQKAYGVDTIEASAQKLMQCVDTARSNTILFLGHTGPFGLGNGRSDIWGIDYAPNEGDGGDVDLQTAVTYAKAQGKRVLAVCAGHMHHRVKGSGLRQWCVELDDTVYINAARVPRIWEENGRWHHHYVHLTLQHNTLSVAEKIFSA